jgi:hypothetical protein
MTTISFDIEELFCPEMLGTPFKDDTRIDTLILEGMGVWIEMTTIILEQKKKYPDKDFSEQQKRIDTIKEVFTYLHEARSTIHYWKHQCLKKETELCKWQENSFRLSDRIKQLEEWKG